MNMYQLDEDSIRERIQNGLLEDTNKYSQGLLTKARILLLDHAKEYISSLKDYSSERYYLTKRLGAAALTQGSQIANSVKSYIVTRMFCGRGSFYRYIAFLAILLPITISVFVIYTNRSEPVSERKVLITNASIKEAADTSYKFSVDRKLIESSVNTAPDSEQNFISTYTVVAHDTITSVAKKFNISEDTIRFANNLTTDTLTPGQNLIIYPVKGI